MKFQGDDIDERNDALGSFSLKLTVCGSGASTAATSAYWPLRLEPTPGGGKMILS
jgi:hypothetical protein